jgi:multisubunit Na+/H+ antiporter MnhE subunit
MSMALTVLGIITGTVVAWILNKILAGRIEDKNHRIGLKITAYIVCIIF